MELQKNHVSDVVYSGMNQPELQQVKARRNYKSNEWLTFVQARGAGLRLYNAKGQGVHLRTFPKDETTGNRFPKHFVVFNLDLTVNPDDNTSTIGRGEPESGKVYSLMGIAEGKNWADSEVIE